jgi:uncharacterized hydrophobic protein (TIGR00271 family)
VNGARLDGTHLCILVVAMLIACIGLNTNSTEAIVGAMLICPLMNSVLAISYGVATADRKVFRTALEGLLVQMAFCLLTSTIYFRLTPLMVETSQILDKSTPTVWDLMIALAGGFAGGLGNSRRQEPATIISGVAVATALMPPLCAAGYGIAVGSLTRFLGATYEFAINVVFIALACELVLLLLRVPLARDLGEDGEPVQAATTAARERARRVRWRVVVATVVFAIPCVLLTRNVVSAQATQGRSASPTEERYEASLTADEIKAICPSLQGYSVGEEYAGHSGRDARVVAHVRTSEALSAEDRTRVERLIRVHVPDLDHVEYATSG